MPRDLSPLRRKLAECHQHVAELREAVAIADDHPDATDELRQMVRADLDEAQAIAAQLESALMILSTPPPGPSEA